MKTYLLPHTGKFYKANLHCHTDYSDGSLSPLQVKEQYRKMGYSIVAYTDHDILIPHDELNDSEFLALHGVEIGFSERNPEAPYGMNRCCHICCIGLEPENVTQPCWNPDAVGGNAVKYRNQVKIDEEEPVYERTFSGENISKIMQTAREKGFFVTYNHPEWSREDYRQYTSYSGMHAMEIMNGNCIVEGFEEYNPRVYDDMLNADKQIYCIGTDDNHGYSDVGVAFTMIKAKRLDYRTITAALEAGNFYASEGPEIQELWVEDGIVHIKCNPADRVICTYYTRRGGRALDKDGSPITEASFDIRNSGYFRLTVIDKEGRHACTNAYFGF